MKLKKILASLLAIVMVLGTMSFSAFAVEAPEEPQIDIDDYSYETSLLSVSGNWADEADTTWYTEGETSYTINSAKQLAGLAKLVNDGTAFCNGSFNNVTITLVADVDLGGKMWTPIGGGEKNETFAGIFDAGEHKISNLYVVSSYNGVGLFGRCAENADFGVSAEIKNVTVENAVVKASGKDGVAAVAGYGHTELKVTNVNVTGVLDIFGYRGVAAVVGKGYADIYECTVKAEGSIASQFWCAGAILGHSDEPCVEISNVKVIADGEGLVIDGGSYAGAGGVAGYIADGSKVDTAVVEGIVIEGDSYYYGGYICGNGYGNATNAQVEDVKMLVDDKPYIPNNEGAVAVYVAKIGDQKYQTLQAAVNDAVEGDTIYLMGTIKDGSVKLPATLTNLTIDGQNTAIVKDTTINASDGGSVVYKGLTIKNTTFENSRFVLGGQRSGDVIYEDLVFDNNKFLNIVNTASMAAIHMNLASEDNEYVKNFTFTNNIINGVTGSNNSGLVLKGLTGDVIFEGNDVSNVAFNAIQIATAKADANLVIKNNSFASSGSSVLNINAAPKATLENNTVVNNGSGIGVWYSEKAKIGETSYKSISAAIADAKDGDTITILAGTYDGFNIPADKNNLTFVGETGSAGTSRAVENLVTIKTLEEGIESHNGGIFVASENTTFKNINFTAGTIPGASSGWMSSSLGNTNGDTGMGSSLKNLTVENCNFTGSGAYQAIWTNQGNVTVKNSTITNYATAIDNYAIGADQEVVIENTEISNVGNAFHTGEAAQGAKINVTNSIIDSKSIDIGGAVAVNVEESTIKNAKVTAYSNSSVNIAYSKLYNTSYAAGHDTASLTLNANYANNPNEILASANAANITYETYYKTEEDLENNNLSKVPADLLTLKFVKADVDANGEDTDENADVYNINLVAADDATINRLNSVDLTFALSNIHGENDFEIIASNEEIAINSVNNSKNRYEFHYDGKDGVKTDCGNIITIGQVKVTGYGTYSFVADATANATNAAHATTIANNIVDTYKPEGFMTNGEGEFDVSDNSIKDITIAVPSRELTINVEFPNSVEKKAADYQDMTVTVSGGDLDKAIVIELGDAAQNVALDYAEKADAKYTVEVDDSYVITLTDVLAVNNSYTVTVEGAGYRTARYTVTMTDNKELTFWNNVMDDEKVIETNKDSSKVTKNFLAGDIVKDNNINIYDLSAVVSYFGEGSNVANGYAKYDLNRDGVIDSKDVAYVLVSWGE